MTGLERLSALELLEGYAARAFSPVEVVEALARRIDETEPALKAFATLAIDRALGEAGDAERLYARRPGDRRPLEGVPLAVKDLMDTAGVRTTYGSPMFADHVPATDAEAVRLARAAGAIVLGKTSTHEFAWGITSHNAHFDWGRNPWATDRVSGGSSGGSGAALAAHEAPLALGTDTGGSIRAPAAFCGVVGLKPTYGRVSTAGVFPLAPSLDHVGPLARTPADAALLFSVLSGSGLTPAAAGALQAELREGVAGLRVAVCADLMVVPLADDVQAVFDSSLEHLEDLGARVVEIALPEGRTAVETFAVIQRAEGLAVHRRAGLFPERRSEYGDDVGGRLDGATATTLEDYMDAAVARERLRAGFVGVFEQTDLLLTPVSAASPVARGSEDQMHRGKTVPFRRLVLPLTTPQDLAGLPACAVRAGFDRLGIPVGAQFTARAGAEGTALRAAQALWEATLPLQKRWPDLGATS